MKNPVKSKREANELGVTYVLLGGSWKRPSYMFDNFILDSQYPNTRLQNSGFRIVRNK
jgi:formylglycine-generating enzyme required for sulfatase activity